MQIQINRSEINAVLAANGMTDTWETLDLSQRRAVVSAILDARGETKTAFLVESNTPAMQDFIVIEDVLTHPEKNLLQNNYLKRILILSLAAAGLFWFARKK